MSRDHRPQTKDRRPKNILLVRLDRIGDVLLSTPAVKALKEAYPGCRISFMVRPYARDILKDNPYIEEILIYDKSGPERDIVGNIKYAMKLRRKQYDLAIIIHPMARAHLVAFLAGIPVRLGYDRKAGFLLTKRIPHTKQYGLKHETDYVMDMLRYIGVNPGDKSTYVALDPVCEDRMKKMLSDSGIKQGDNVVAIGPGASCVSKRWPKKKFAIVAEELKKRVGAKIVILAGPSDKEYGDGTAYLIKSGCINLTAKTSIGDVASILRRSRVFISNDSGLVHIACAVGTPVIDIFGRNDAGLSPRRWGPTGKNDIVLHKDADCDICLAHKCKIGFKCLRSVAIKEVILAAQKIINNKEE